MELNIFELQKLIERCLREDLGAGDLTTNSTVPAGAWVSQRRMRRA